MLERWHRWTMPRKPLPPSSKISKIDRPGPVAYARRMKTDAEIEDDGADPVTKDDSKTGADGASKGATTDAKDPKDAPTDSSKAATTTADSSKAAGNAGATTGTASTTAATAADSSKAAATVVDSSKAAGDSSTKATGATTLGEQGEAPKAPPQGERSRAATLVMPMVSGFGVPPEVPTAAGSAPRVSHGTVEDPTHMPSPREIPGGQPTDPAAPPGRVPRGDSRSLRRADEFALVYRVGTFVISRFGSTGQRGQWRVVEYPTSSSASHAYAKECSRFVAEGFSDYRD